MCHKTTRRILSLLLVLAMILTGPFSVTAVASPTSGAEDLTFHEVDAGSVSTQLDSTAGQEVESLQTGQTLYEDTDQVRVTIFLEPAATLERPKCGVQRPSHELPPDPGPEAGGGAVLD